MKRIPNVGMLLAAHLFLAILSPAQVTKNVLVLHLDSANAPANLLITQAVQEVFSSDASIQLFEEYVDENRLLTDYAALMQVLHLKYAAKKIDLVLAAGQPALKFMLQYGAELWPNVPKVFANVDFRQLPLTLPPNTTGVAGTLDFGESLDLALRLQPDVNQVFYVGGVSPQEEFRRGLAMEDFRRFEPEIAFTYLNDLPLPALLERLGRLPAHSIVIFALLQKDAAGDSFVGPKICPSIVASANAPVYVPIETLIGCGTVGGSSFRVSDAARQAAQLGLDILRGKVTANHPVEKAPPDQLMVDWRQLRKWNLAESRLPKGTIVLFREPGIWDRFGPYLIVGAVVLMLQSALTILLMIQRSRRRQSELTVRRLTGRILHAGEEERKHISRELHDDIGQRLSLVKVRLGMFVARLPESAVSDPDLNNSMDEVDDIITDVHNLSHRLHSSKLEHLGLNTALRDICRQMAQKYQIDIQFKPAENLTSLQPSVALCFYRVAQEALANAAKHSESARAEVSVMQKTDLLRMEIRDFGMGFDPASHREGLGLVTMEERLRAIGGRLLIVSRRNQGTQVVAEAPLDEASRPEAA